MLEMYDYWSTGELDLKEMGEAERYQTRIKKAQMLALCLTVVCDEQRR